MGTFLVLLLIAFVLVAGGGVALLPALLVISAVTLAIWLVSSIIGVLFHLVGGVLGLAFSLAFGAMALVFGFMLLPLMFPLLLLAGIVYLITRNRQPLTSQPASSAV